MYTTVAFSAAPGITAVFLPVAPAPGEDHVTAVAPFIFVPAFAPKLLGAYVGGVGVLRAQLQSPTLRRLFMAELSPLSVLQEPGIVQELIDLFEKPYDLKVGEPLEAMITTGGAGIHTIVVFLGDGPVTKDNRPHLTIMAAGGAAAVANTWTVSPLAFLDVLPAGEFDIIGMRFESTTCVAARLIIPGAAHRPGVLGCDVPTDQQAARFRHGEAGVLGHFVSATPPLAQILCTAADAAVVQFAQLDLVQTA